MRFFDLYHLPDIQRGWARETIRDFNAHGFSFAQLCSKQLQRETGRTRIPITIADLSKQGWAAVTWTDGRLIIDDDFNNNEDGFRKVLGHELAHVAEFYWLTPRLITKMVNIYERVYGPVRWQGEGGISHPWTAGFQVAFSRHKEADDDVYHPVSPIPELIRGTVVQ